MAYPKIIQGGMGVAVSGHVLARAISKTGQLGVVSGTALALVMARRLQLGDRDGKVRHALAHLPMPDLAERILQEYFVPDGKEVSKPFRGVPMPTLQADGKFMELSIAASFVEVFLAKEGHNGVVGINLLEKIQLGTLPSLFGAMLAKVDYVLVGAGIPRSIPGALDQLAAGRIAELKIEVDGEQAGDDFIHRLDPLQFFPGKAPVLKRPLFLAIVSSATLALTLARKSNGKVDGFVVELGAAGGHNAPPRGPLQLSPAGEPVYGPRDVPDLAKIRELGLPFWVAGSQATPEQLAEALKLGANGIQVGTSMAFSDESGVDPDLKRRVIDLCRTGLLRVFTDPFASPTGFPFKVLQLLGTLSDPKEYAERPLICDIGYLRSLYRNNDGTLGYRCASEPVEDYVAKGGDAAHTVGRKCLCNGLLATAGLGQIRNGRIERAIVTAGNEIANLARLLKPGAQSYSAVDVVHYLLGEANPAPCCAPAI